MSINKPMILVFAGPNGSGKSTITQYFEKVGVYTNADDVVMATGASNEEAARMVDDKRYMSIQNKEDFSFETVLSSDYKLNLLRKAKSEGYFIKCIFVLTAHPAINVSRVEVRVLSGGHSVDRDKIIKRYKKSIDNIKHLMEICDVIHVYDNTDEPTRIIRKRKDEIAIFPNEIWKEDEIIKIL